MEYCAVAPDVTSIVKINVSNNCFIIIGLAWRMIFFFIGYVWFRICLDFGI